MTYSAVYCALISKRLNNPISKEDCYCETHHIIPKSEGGEDTPDNLVNLTPREHYIAHLLLWKIYKDQKMASAVVMFRTRSELLGIDIRNSRCYQMAREHYSKWCKENFSGEKNPAYGQGGTFRGKKHSEETKRKIALANTGKKFSAEHCRKISLAKKNPSDETRRKLSVSSRGRKIVRSSEYCRNISIRQRGRKLSEETKRKIALSRKGKTMSKEARMKMSIA